VLDGVALGLPALLRAEKLLKRAARTGFEWPDAAAAFVKVAEELEEIKQEIEMDSDRERIGDEIGDLLFAGAALARSLGIDPRRRCAAPTRSSSAASVASSNWSSAPRRWSSFGIAGSRLKNWINNML